MGIILEVVGVISIVMGVILSLSGVGLPAGMVSILGGVLLWAVGSTNRVAKKNSRLLEELKIWMQAKR